MPIAAYRAGRRQCNRRNGQREDVGLQPSRRRLSEFFLRGASEGSALIAYASEHQTAERHTSRRQLRFGVRPAEYSRRQLLLWRPARFTRRGLLLKCYPTISPR